ncbi:hypothetical protein Tco_0287125 [Tanacetum coccineum]
MVFCGAHMVVHLSSTNIMMLESDSEWTQEMSHQRKRMCIQAVQKIHLRRFLGMVDAKFEAFTISSKESLEKGYDRFQKLLSQLEALGAGVSDEDANHKFLRSLPPAWDNIPKRLSLVFSASDIVVSISPSQTSFNHTNADDVDLIHEDLDQIDDLDLEEMDINWQIAMTAIKIKKFYKKTGRRPRVDGKMHVAFDKRKVECFNCHNTGHFARDVQVLKVQRKEAGKGAVGGQDFKPVRTEKEALMTIDEGQINWVEQTTDEELNHALMAFTVNNEVSMCSKLCLDSYNALQAKYDEFESEFGTHEDALVDPISYAYEKLKKFRRIGMIDEKFKRVLQKIVAVLGLLLSKILEAVDCG